MTTAQPAPRIRPAQRHDARDPDVRRRVAPRVRLGSVLISFVRWNLTHLRWRLHNLADTLRGRGTLEAKADRLREAIERMGGTAVVVGQQLAMRIDLMPLEFSLALQAMVDRHPPMPLSVALRRMAKAFGRPTDEVFAAFDPEPTLSTRAFCTYRARLLDGCDVAVKVRREGIRNRMMSEVVAVGWVTRLLEASTLWRPGFFASLHEELLEYANGRLDLNEQARYQSVFRRLVRRDGPGWLSAPRVHAALSNHAVLVTDHEPGVPLADLVDAVGAGDRQALARFAEFGIDPVVVSRRLLHTAWWGAFESLFFVAGIDASNVLVQPGNKLVLVELDDCAALPATHKRQFQLVLTRLGRDDVSGAARALVQVMAPLPFIDVYALTKRIETGLWEQLLALRDDEAQWWERTTIGLWRTAVRAARADGVSLRMSTNRFMQAVLSYDTLAARLDPKLRLLREHQRYQRAADTRAAKRARKELDRLDPDDLQAAWVAQVARLGEGVQRVLGYVEATVENLPVSNLALSGKAAYAVSQLVRAAGWTLALLAAFTLVQPAGSWPSAVGGAAQSAGFVVCALVLAASTLRRILYRLDDKQP